MILVAGVYPVRTHYTYAEVIIEEQKYILEKETPEIFCNYTKILYLRLNSYLETQAYKFARSIQ